MRVASDEPTRRTSLRILEFIEKDDALVHHTVRPLSCQAAGHSDCFFVLDTAGERSEKLYKKHEPKEFANYVEIFEADDSMQHVVPRFHGGYAGEVDHMSEGHHYRSPKEARESRSEHAQFMVLQNVLSRFKAPIAMDCKLGIRSFEESEIKSKKGRTDLFERLLKIGPEYLTEAERQSRSVTKYKWMSARDTMGSLRSLGFRIDGIAGNDGKNVHADYFASIDKRSEVIKELRAFVNMLSDDPVVVDERGLAEAKSPLKDIGAGITEAANLEMRLEVTTKLVERLREQREQCESSPFFLGHEFIGASLLICAEASPPTATSHLIDLAKTSALPEGLTVDHRQEWRMGNHEDGLLFGLDNIILCFEEVQALLRAELNAVYDGRSLSDQAAAAPTDREACCHVNCQQTCTLS